jgi:hypothetical protein
MSTLLTYAQIRNDMNDRERLGDVQAERREEAQDSIPIGSLNLLTIHPAVLWVVPSNSFLLLGPVSCLFMSRTKTVGLEIMLRVTR